MRHELILSMKHEKGNFYPKATIKCINCEEYRYVSLDYINENIDHTLEEACIFFEKYPKCKKEIGNEN